jgi:hypothetical protein
LPFLVLLFCVVDWLDIQRLNICKDFAASCEGEMKRWIPSDDETGDRATNQKNESSLFDGQMQRLYSLVNDHQICYFSGAVVGFMFEEILILETCKLS